MAVVKVVHLITGLQGGGAETMLARLLGRMDRTGFQNTVISLLGEGVIGKRLLDDGIPVHHLSGSQGGGKASWVFKLAGLLRALRPDLIQTWMYHADLFGSLGSRVLPDVPLIWGIHNSNLDPASSRLSTRLIVKGLARLSGWIPDRIVSCSEVARDLHVALGYPQEKMVVIPNGFDVGAFAPDPQARLSLRQELGLSGDALLIGRIGRAHPQKDNANFLKAALLVVRRYPQVHFLLCGDGLTRTNPEVGGLVSLHGLENRCHLLGRREDLPRVNAALDIACSSSAFGEAFPLVLGEAMACGVPCVTTDVGDSAALVRETGLVVPPRDEVKLSEALISLIEQGPEGRAKLGWEARERIKSHYSLPVVVSRYEKLYRERVGG
ncbi:MAG: glycosyltransferase [Magnetococcales bacterium]|nr:glycosyltransferase [Magnetococcales bacterium]